MSLLHALVLAVLQGVAEIVPVSGSAHRVLVPYAFGWHAPPAAFQIAVHTGVLCALVWTFRARIAELARAVRKPDEPNRALLRLIAIGTAPAAVVGIALSSVADRWLQRPVLVAVLLGASGWALMNGEHAAQENTDRAAENEVARNLAELRGDEPPPPVSLKDDETSFEPVDGAVAGIAQAVAVVPGVSRTAATLSAGLHRGMTREAAARFSFLLAIPFVAGSLAVKIPDAVRHGAHGTAGAIAIGVVVSGIAAGAALRWFLGAVSKRGLKPFALYCFVGTVAGLLTALARG